MTFDELLNTIESSSRDAIFSVFSDDAYETAQIFISEKQIIRVPQVVQNEFEQYTIYPIPVDYNKPIKICFKED